MRINDFLELKWEEPEANPLIRPAMTSPLIADPTFLPPAETPDGRWHLFAHSLRGLRHYTSTDGLAWDKQPGLVMPWGVRAFLFRESDGYCLFYERLLNMLPMHSRIEVITSHDLFRWSQPVIVLEPSLAWHRAGSRRGTVGNPCVIADVEGYRLYYSAGVTFLNDCKFYEPRFIGQAYSRRALGRYEPQFQPILAPNADDSYANLGAGAVKVVKTDDGYIGFQNGIYWDQAANHTRSAIRLLAASDGTHWRPLLPHPIMMPGSTWKRSHVYALDIREVEGAWVMYFNARDGWLLGRERIGRAVGLPVGVLTVGATVQVQSAVELV